MKKLILIVSLLVFLIAGGVGYYLYNKPVPSTHNKLTDLKIESENLISDFEEDEIRANQKYLNKVIEIKGQVGHIDVTTSGTTIYLSGAQTLSRVACEMEPGSDFSEIIVGKDLTIKGVCSGYLMDVVLSRCVIQSD